MYLVTNRNLNLPPRNQKLTTQALGNRFNELGPGELRFLKVQRVYTDWQFDLYENQPNIVEVQRLNARFHLNLDSKSCFASLKVASEVYDQAKLEKKNVLFYVHGHNNDIEDILSTGHILEKEYNLIVVIFSWPANSGGRELETSYAKSDRLDARISAEAFNRLIEKTHYFHSLLTQALSDRLYAKAMDKYGDNAEVCNAVYSRLLSRECSTKISLMCHSLGAYILKRALSSSDSSLNQLVFDNIVLISADTKSQDHHLWLDKLDARHRCYVMINEMDDALNAGRKKPGGEQSSRLGQNLNQLCSTKARYIDVSHMSFIEKSHAYFKGNPTKNKALKLFFSKALNGEISDELLHHQSTNNSYRIEDKPELKQIKEYHDNYGFV